MEIFDSYKSFRLIFNLGFTLQNLQPNFEKGTAEIFEIPRH